MIIYYLRACLRCGTVVSERKVKRNVGELSRVVVVGRRGCAQNPIVKDFISLSK